MQFVNSQYPWWKFSGRVWNVWNSIIWCNIIPDFILLLYNNWNTHIFAMNFSKKYFEGKNSWSLHVTLANTYYLLTWFISGIFDVTWSGRWKQCIMFMVLCNQWYSFLLCLNKIKFRVFVHFLWRWWCVWGLQTFHVFNELLIESLDVYFDMHVDKIK